jgi:hypothetical protein
MMKKIRAYVGKAENATMLKGMVELDDAYFSTNLWINHSIHHYKDGEIVFGVSTPLWDYIYGTMYKKALQIHDYGNHVGGLESISHGVPLKN